VVKVLNPNAEYHTDRVCEVLERLLANLAAKNDGGYEVARAALAEIKEWIKQDIGFAGFLEKDALFYRQNHGYRPAGSPYMIIVPRSKGADNRYYKREEYIEGTNLTEMDRLREQGFDLKRLVALLVSSYWQQIQNGLVHSDVHPGNFRVTAEGNVAILDRNFFLELDEKDRVFLGQLLSGAADRRALSAAIVDYLHLPFANAAKTIENILAEMDRAGLGPLEQVRQLVIFLKRQKVRIPLKIILLIKNINALNDLAKQAGFSGLPEAFTY
jgi:hypothetical protein